MSNQFFNLMPQLPRITMQPDPAFNLPNILGSPDLFGKPNMHPSQNYNNFNMFNNPFSDPFAGQSANLFGNMFNILFAGMIMSDMLDDNKINGSPFGRTTFRNNRIPGNNIFDLFRQPSQNMHSNSFGRAYKIPQLDLLEDLFNFGNKNFPGQRKGKPAHNSVPEMNLRQGDGQDFLEALGARESRGDYKAVNRFGYAGKYQFGTGALIDTGFKHKDGSWTGKMGVHSKQDFLNTPEAQEVAMRDFTKRNWTTLKSLGADKYIGKIVGGVKVTKSGLLAASHLGGAGNVNKFLKTGGSNVFKDGNDTPITEYMRKFGGYDVQGIA